MASNNPLRSGRPGLRRWWTASAGIVLLAVVLPSGSACRGEQPRLNRPNGVAVAADGTLLVVDKNNYRVARLDPGGIFLTWFGGLGDRARDLPAPYDIALGPGGKIYVSDRSYGDGGGYKSHDGVKVFSAEGRFLREVGGQDYRPGDPNNGPYGLDVDSAGNVYIADYHRNRIRKFDAGGELVMVLGRHGLGPGELNGPNDVAVDEERGFLYVVESKNARVQKFTLDGEHVRSFGRFGRDEDEFSYPQYVDLDAEGNLYVSDMGNRRIKKYDPEGRFLRAFAPTGAAALFDCQLMGVTVRPVPSGDGSHRHEILAVDTMNNRILVFDEAAGLKAVLG